MPAWMMTPQVGSCLCHCLCHCRLAAAERPARLPLRYDTPVCSARLLPCPYPALHMPIMPACPCPPTHHLPADGASEEGIGAVLATVRPQSGGDGDDTSSTDEEMAVAPPGELACCACCACLLIAAAWLAGLPPRVCCLRPTLQWIASCTGGRQTVALS
jgi:hypothetical protein